MSLDTNKIEVLESLPNQIDWGIKSVNADKVWHLTKGEGVKIATIDTGVDINHVELNSKISKKFNFIDRNFDVSDEYGHGTMVAGLLVGENTGIAPKSKLITMKVLDGNGKGSISNVMDGITYALNSKVDILCISLGMPNDMPLILRQRIVQAYDKGLIIVGAVGNNSGESLFPAKMNEVIGVGGLDKDMKFANFSNRDYDVLAPSVEILSTFKDGKYARMTGTSFASPIVAGGIALILSYYRKQGIELNNKQIKEMVTGKFNLTDLIK